MKALSTTMIIVVTIIVILIAALVILTIFGQGVTPIATLAEAKSLCISEATSTCATTGTLPITWTAPNKNVQGELMSCQRVMGIECEMPTGCTCSMYGLSVPS